MRILVLMFAAVASLRATGNTCTLTKTGPCSSGACNLSITAESGGVPWTGTGCTGTGYLPSADNIIGSNAVALTVDQNWTVGTAPANDTSTAALACVDPASGSFILNVAAGITLTYQGTVQMCNTYWSVAGGGILRHDGTAQGIAYTWWGGQAAGSGLNLGSANSQRAKWTIIGTQPNGGYRLSAAFNGSGSLDCEHADIDHWGASDSGISYNPRPLSTSIVKFNDCSIDRAYQFNPQAQSADAPITITRTTWTNPQGTSGNNLGAALIEGAAPLTNFVASYSWLQGGWYNEVAGTNYQHVIFEDTRTPVAGSANWPGVVSATLNDVWRLASRTDTASGSLPSGTITDLFTQVYANALNNHAWEQGTGNLSFTGSICEMDVWDKSGDCYQFHAAQAAGTVTTLQGHIVTLNAIGGSSGSFLNWSSSDATNAHIEALNNSYSGLNQSGGSEGMGIMAEATSGAAGMYQRIANNLAYSPTLPAGFSTYLTYVPSTVALANGAYSGLDYNACYGCLATNVGRYEIGGGTGAQYAAPAPPGTHDLVATDPQMFDAIRAAVLAPSYYLGITAAAWATGTAYNVGDIVSVNDSSGWSGRTTLWRCIQAHTATGTYKPGTGTQSVAPAFYDRWEPALSQILRTNTVAGNLITDPNLGCGPTGSYPTGCTYSQAILQWIRKGWTPRAAAYATAGCAGPTISSSTVNCTGTTFIGAVQPAPFTAAQKFLLAQ